MTELAASPGAVLRDAASQIFSPAFLWAVYRGDYDCQLRNLGLAEFQVSIASVGGLFEFLYRALDRVYRSEYYFKNEIIRRIFEARHNPDRSTVLLEKHIGNWASRVDLIVINDTTTAYEVKTDLDNFSRLRSQTDHALKVFDRVYVVCSERRTATAGDIVDERVGVLGMRNDGSFRRERPAVSNASGVVPGAVFDLLRQGEYLSALKRRFGTLPALDSIERYEYCADLFSKLSAESAHAVLLHALRRRYVRPDREPLARLPYALAHLYYKATVKERNMLFSPAMLHARVRVG